MHIESWPHNRSDQLINARSAKNCQHCTCVIATDQHQQTETMPRAKALLKLRSSYNHHAHDCQQEPAYSLAPASALTSYTLPTMQHTTWNLDRPCRIDTTQDQHLLKHSCRSCPHKHSAKELKLGGAAGYNECRVQ